MTVDNNDVIQVVADWVLPGGQHQQNKFIFLAQLASGQTEAAVMTALSTALAALYDELSAEIPSTLQDPVLACDKLAWVTDHWEVSANIGETSCSTTSTNGSDYLPLPVAAYLVGRTARPRSRGRKFMPSFGEDRQAGSGLIAAAQTALGNALLDYLSDITISPGNTLVPGIASTVTGTFLPFVSGIAASILGTQRRRHPSRGI